MIGYVHDQLVGFAGFGLVAAGAIGVAPAYERARDAIARRWPR